MKLICFASQGMINKARSIKAELKAQYPKSIDLPESEDGLFIYEDNISIAVAEPYKGKIKQMPTGAYHMLKTEEAKEYKAFNKMIEFLNIDVPNASSVYISIINNKPHIVRSINIKSL